jgi:DAK2 domain fusion protein YloV
MAERTRDDKALSLGALGEEDLISCLKSGFRRLNASRDLVNRLNVYPVPDGDTGTNMAMTLQAALEEAEAVQARAPRPEATDTTNAPGKSIPAAVAHGALMGARGNSGVILCQWIRGLTEGIEESGTWDVVEGLKRAAELSLDAVSKPVEGTVLTVAREAAQAAIEAGVVLADSLEVLGRTRQAAGEALARTPEQLEALAQAGVVDAGGAGLLLILDGFVQALGGTLLSQEELKSFGLRATSEEAGELWQEERESPAPDAILTGGVSNGPSFGMISPRYEVMYRLSAPDEAVAGFKEAWAGIGDSIVVAGGNGLYNCHIHTDDVGAAIEAALDVGRPRDIRVTDLAEQVEEERWVRERAAQAKAEEEADVGPPVRCAVVAVCVGEGIRRIFRSLGVHRTVVGGQTMNPSTQDLLEAIEQVPSDQVILLPDNDNVLPVARQAAELSEKEVAVVPTSGVVEGFAALLEYDPEADLAQNLETMQAAASHVVAGEVTMAVRDSVTGAGPVRKGQWIGMSRQGVEVVADELDQALLGLVEKLLSPGSELVSLFEGEGASTAVTRKVSSALQEAHGDLAVEVHHGGQPLYPYLVSVE